MSLIKTHIPTEQDTIDWWRSIVTGKVDKNDVYYLRGTFAGEHEVEGTVSIHKKQDILFPVINALAEHYKEEVMIADANGDIEATDEKHVFIDGDELAEDQIHAVGPIAFDLTVPTGGFGIGHFRLEGGTHKVASHGFWVRIPRGSLSQGFHKISFNGNSKGGFHTARSYSVYHV